MGMGEITQRGEEGAGEGSGGEKSGTNAERLRHLRLGRRKAVSKEA